MWPMEITAVLHKQPWILRRWNCESHYNDVIMGAIESQITSVTIVFSTVYLDTRKTSKLRVTGICAGNSPEATEFPAQMENISIWWRHHALH